METARIVVRGSVLRAVSLVAYTLVGFFLMPFVVHSLGDRVYGYWVLVGTILGYYGLLDLGIVSAVQFHVAKALGEKDTAAANRAICTTFFSFAALGLVIALLTVIVAAFSPYFIKSPADATLFRHVILVMGFGFALGFPGRAFVGALSAHLRWDVIASIGLGILAIRTGLIVFVIKAGWGIVSLATVTVLGDIVMYSLYYLMLRRIQTDFTLLPGLASMGALKEVLNYSSYTLIIKISEQLRFYLDAVVVGAFLAVSAVTHYSVASRLALSYRELMIALLGSLSPWFSSLLGRREYSQMKRVFELGTRISVSVSTIVACCLLVYGKRFIAAWMGKSYTDAYWPLCFLVGAIFFDVSQIPSPSYLFGVSRHRFLAYMTLVEGVFNLALSLYFVRFYGLAGVALGSFIPMATLWFLVLPIYTCQQVGIRASRYYWELFGRTALVNAGAILIPWFLVFKWLVGTGLVSIVAVIACQVVIAVGAAYLCSLERTEREAVRRIVFGRPISGTGMVEPRPDEAVVSPRSGS